MPDPKIRKAIAVWRLCAAAEWCASRWAFENRGFGTVAEILKAAGMSRRSYYEFFTGLPDQLERMHYATKRAAGGVHDSKRQQELLMRLPSCEHLYIFSVTCAFDVSLCVDHVIAMTKLEAPRPVPVPMEGLAYQWCEDIVHSSSAERREVSHG